MFHTRGPAAAKHRSPKLLFDRRTTHVAVSVDRSRRVLSWQSSARYAVAGQLAGQTLKDQDGDLEGHSLMHGQPVELS